MALFAWALGVAHARIEQGRRSFTHASLITNTMMVDGFKNFNTKGTGVPGVLT